MDLYPVFLKLDGRRVVVAGAGKVAERKIKSLLSTGAWVTVVAPHVLPTIRRWAEEGAIRLFERKIVKSDLDQAFMVVAATDDRQTNAWVAELCHERGILVNVVDDPGAADFFVPATVRRGPLAVAVGTGGRWPALARIVREELELRFVPEYAELADLLVNLPQRHKTGGDLRSLLLRALELLRQGKRSEAEELLGSCLSRPLD